MNQSKFYHKNSNGDYCELNRSTERFNLTLSLLPANSPEWKQFVESSLKSDDAIFRLLRIREIQKATDSSWIPRLLCVAQSEQDATVLGEVYSVLTLYDAFGSISDFEKIFLAKGFVHRIAALAATRHLPASQAVIVLENVLAVETDDSVRVNVATRLAYLGSDLGEADLLRSLEGDFFFIKLSSACALCAINNTIGNSIIINNINIYNDLLQQEKVNLIFCLEYMLQEVGIAISDSSRESILCKTMAWMVETSRGGCPD